MRRNKEKKITQLLAYAICLSLFASGCRKDAEVVMDYGTEKTTVERGSGTTEIGQGTETGNSKSTEAPGARNGHTLSDQLGGTELSCQEEFTLGSKAGKMDAKIRIMDYRSMSPDNPEEFRKAVTEGMTNGFMIHYDTDTLPSYRLHEITEDKIYEKEVVKNILGDSAVEVHREIGIEHGDSQSAVSAAQSIYNAYVRGDSDSRKRQQENFPAWAEDEQYTLHTYEGTYNGLATQLVIAYRKDLKSKAITFGPKNWADVVDAPGYTENQIAENGELSLPVKDEEKDKEKTFKFQSLEEYFPGLTNRTEGNLETMRSDAKAFAEDKLLLKLPASPFSDERVFGNKPGQIIFFPKGELDKDDPKDVILDGYDIRLAIGLANQGYYTELGATEYIRENFGSVSITKKGIVSADFHIAYDYEERLSDQVAILPFDKAMDALQEGVASELDLSKVPNSEITLREPNLVYYKVPSPDVAGEYTCIPAWVLSVFSGQYYFVGQVLQNAMDGSIIRIEYNE